MTALPDCFFELIRHRLDSLPMCGDGFFNALQDLRVFGGHIPLFSRIDSQFKQQWWGVSLCFWLTVAAASLEVGFPWTEAAGVEGGAAVVHERGSLNIACSE